MTNRQRWMRLIAGMAAAASSLLGGCSFSGFSMVADLVPPGPPRSPVQIEDRRPGPQSLKFPWGVAGTSDCHYGISGVLENQTRPDRITWLSGALAARLPPRFAGAHVEVRRFDIFMNMRGSKLRCESFGSPLGVTGSATVDFLLGVMNTPRCQELYDVPENPMTEPHTAGCAGTRSGEYRYTEVLPGATPLIGYLDAHIDGCLVQARGIFTPTKRNRDNEVINQNLNLNWDRAVQGVLDAVVEDFILSVDKQDEFPRTCTP